MINQEEALRKICALLYSMNIPEAKILFLLDILQWALENNYFYFLEETFKQVVGTAMGANVAPTFANLFLIFHEKILKRKLKERWPKLYFRLLDDIFFVWEGTRTELDEFLKMFDELSPSLSFTQEIKEKKIAILDLTIYKGKRFESNNVLDYCLYEKPTNQHLFTNPIRIIPSHTDLVGSPAKMFEFLEIVLTNIHS